MNICTTCGYGNREGYLFCEDCGFPIKWQSSNTSTRQFNSETDDIIKNVNPGTARLRGETSVFLVIGDPKERLLLTLDNRVVLGREDEGSTSQPTIDLVPFGGVSKGVSRVHAAIEKQDDMVVLSDLGSSNGTYLNGNRLPSQQPRVLRDGDEICFGKLMAHIYFK